MKYTKAVSATLASALAVGMVPAMALADDAQLELLDSVEAVKAFNEGAITGAAWSNGEAYNFTVGATNSKMVTGDELCVVPSQITPKGGAAITLGDATAELYKITYVTAGADGKPTSTVVEEPEVAGNYFAVVTATEKSPYAGGVMYLPFSLTSKVLDGAVAYEIDAEDPTNISDTDFMYDGEVQPVAFKLGNKVLVEGVDYTVKYFKAGADIYGSDYTTTAPTVKGSYTALLTGLGDYAGDTAEAKFDIAPFLFAGKTVVVADIAGNATALPTTVNSIDGSTAMNDEVKLRYDAWPGNETGANPTVSKGGLGQYTATVLPLDANGVDDPNFGANASKVVTFNKVTNLATFKYDGAAWDDEWTVLKNDSKTEFDTDEIEVYDASGKLLDASKYTVTVDGPSADFSASGEYTVTVQVKAADFQYALGGTAVTKVTVLRDAVDAKTNVYVAFNGVVTNSIVTTYDPAEADLKDDIAVKVYDSKGVAHTDGFVVKYIDANGKEVTGALKTAGKYTMQIIGTKYDIANGTIPVEIKPIEISKIKLTGAGVQNINGQLAVGYNNGAPVYAVEAYVDADKDGKEDAGEWKAATAYTATDVVYMFNGKKVDGLKDMGWYEISLVLDDSADAVNYKVTAETLKMEVTVALDFIDVPATHWAYNVIKTAKTNGYVNGYGDGKLYGPDNAIKRADFVCVLYNMAGCPKITGTNWTEGMGYDLSFSDVNDNAYYAPALAWAEDAGVVNGYDDGTFKPSKNISRQEALAMLANYAKAAGDFVAPADADVVLAKFPDGAKVSNWAEESVAWAAAEKIAGNGGVLNPLSSITRAEVAAIAVNYQPAKLV